MDRIQKAANRYQLDRRAAAILLASQNQVNTTRFSTAEDGPPFVRCCTVLAGLVPLPSRLSSPPRLPQEPFEPAGAELLETRHLRLVVHGRP